MVSFSLSFHTFKRLSAVALLGVFVSMNSVFAEDPVIHETPATDVEIVTETVVPEVAPLFTDILPEVIPDSIVSDETSVSTEISSEETTILPESTEMPLLIEEIISVPNPDIPFADTPALEPEITAVTDNLSIPLFWTESSGVAAYNVKTETLLFTTFLEDDTLDTSVGSFSENGEYIFFRTTDPNWCSGLTLDECRATSTQQAMITITSIPEPILVDEVVLNEILSVEEGDPAGEGDVLAEDIIVEETTLPAVPPIDLPEEVVPETIPTDTNTYIPPVVETIEEVLPPASESTSEIPLVIEEIAPIVDTAPTVTESVAPSVVEEIAPISAE